MRGLSGEGAGDGDALALAAGEFVREAELEVRAEPDEVKQFGGAALGVGDAVDLHRLGDLLADDVAWVERSVGVLEDHLGEAGELLALEGAGVEAIDGDGAGPVSG